MNVQGNELESAQIDASSEANAADAAMETESVKSSEEDASEVDSLIDYNLVEETSAEKAAKAKRKEADKKALREMLANKGFAMRNLLRENHVKAHFTSPFSTEDQMSPEDILSDGNTERRPTRSRRGTKTHVHACIFRAEVDNSHNQSA